MLANHRGGFEAVHARHVDVEENGGELHLHELGERFGPGSCAYEILVERFEDRFVAKEPRGLIVDEKDVDFVGVHASACAASAGLAWFPSPLGREGRAERGVRRVATLDKRTPRSFSCFPPLPIPPSPRGKESPFASRFILSMQP